MMFNHTVFPRGPPFSCTGLKVEELEKSRGAGKRSSNG